MVNSGRAEWHRWMVSVQALQRIYGASWVGQKMIVVPDHGLIIVSMDNTEQEQSVNYLRTMK